MLIMNLLS